MNSLLQFSTSVIELHNSKSNIHLHFCLANIWDFLMFFLLLEIYIPYLRIVDYHIMIVCRRIGLRILFLLFITLGKSFVFLRNHLLNSIMVLALIPSSVAIRAKWGSSGFSILAASCQLWTFKNIILFYQKV